MNPKPLVSSATELRDEADLRELLRRCHRGELVPLAEILGIRSEHLGLSQLVRAIERTLRRRGAQDLWNIIRRRGEGPPYAVVVEGLVSRRGLKAGAEIVEMEQALLKDWVERAWEEMPAEERDRVWRRLQLEVPAPVHGAQALVSVSERLQVGAKYGVGIMAVTALRVMPVLFPPLLPLAGCFAVFYLGRPDERLLLPAVLEVSALRQTVRHRVTVGVVGSPSSGKDAAIRAIFGIDSGNVNPVAGSTTEVEITRLPTATALFVVNTPGLGDIIESVTEEARQVLGLIDVFVYVVNAQGGVQARELSDYRECLSRGRPVLAVVNKIDTLREADRHRYLTDAQQKLSAPDADFLAAAFDPLPQLSDTPIGLEEVREWIEERLFALGKDPAELPWIESC